MTTPHPPEELIERLRARSERHRDQSGDMLFYGQRDQDLDEAADLLTLQASHIEKLEEAILRHDHFNREMLRYSGPDDPNLDPECAEDWRNLLAALSQTQSQSQEKGT